MKIVPARWPNAYPAYFLKCYLVSVSNEKFQVCPISRNEIFEKAGYALGHLAGTIFILSRASEVGSPTKPPWAPGKYFSGQAR